MGGVGASGATHPRPRTNELPPTLFGALWLPRSRQEREFRQRFAKPKWIQWKSLHIPVMRLYYTAGVPTSQYMHSAIHLGRRAARIATVYFWGAGRQ